MTPLETAVAKYLKSTGAWFLKTNPRAHGGRWGIPDFLVCYQGVFLGLEVKRYDDKETRLQEIELNGINGAGGIGRIVRSVEEVRAILEEING